MLCIPAVDFDVLRHMVYNQRGMNSFIQQFYIAQRLLLRWGTAWRYSYEAFTY